MARLFRPRFLKSATGCVFCRHRLQFSLRAFLIVLTVMCVGLGWWAERTWRQYEVVAAILKAGGRVLYPWDRRSPGEIGPTHVEIKEHDRHLWLDFVTSPDGVQFNYQCNVNDDICRCLAELQNLNALDIADTPITDVGISRFSGLTQLDWLVLNGTRITGDGLAHLNNLAKLDVLGLRGTGITDDGLVHLKHLTKLKTLLLTDTRITDNGLAHLKHLGELHTLDVKNTQITDQGLEHLMGLQNLRRLTLVGCAVTDAGVSRLKQALPDCRVFLTRGEWVPPSD